MICLLIMNRYNFRDLNLQFWISQFQFFYFVNFYFITDRGVQKTRNLVSSRVRIDSNFREPERLRVLKSFEYSEHFWATWKFRLPNKLKNFMFSLCKPNFHEIPYKGFFFGLLINKFEYLKTFEFFRKLEPELD